MAEIEIKRDTAELAVSEVKKPRDYHRFSMLFPLMDGEDYEALVEDIRANGLHEEIILHPDGRIPDGRNRDRACLEAGVKLRFRTYDGDDPLGFVISLNLKRRHLNESQRGILAARVADMPQGARTDRNLAPIGAKSNTEAATQFHVGKRTVNRAKRVLKECPPDVIEAVDRGEQSVTGALAEQTAKPLDASEHREFPAKATDALRADADAPVIDGEQVLHAEALQTAKPDENKEQDLARLIEALKPFGAAWAAASQEARAEFIGMKDEQLGSLYRECSATALIERIERFGVTGPRD